MTEDDHNKEYWQFIYMMAFHIIAKETCNKSSRFDLFTLSLGIDQQDFSIRCEEQEQTMLIESQFKYLNAYTPLDYCKQYACTFIINIDDK